MANNRLNELELIMDNAESYAEYKDAAQAHDELSVADEWKAKDACKDYDYRAIRTRVKRLREAKFSDEQINKIFGPIGIKLGGRSAPEIALSIISQLVSEIYKRK